jgi:hypothetical protein
MKSEVHIINTLEKEVKPESDAVACPKDNQHFCIWCSEVWVGENVDCVE